MSKANRQKADSIKPMSGKIIINEVEGLVFSSEEDLYKHFINEISILEKEFFKLRRESVDLSKDDFVKYEKNLPPTLETPDEVWEDQESIPGKTLMIYLKEFPEQIASKNGELPGKEDFLFHVAICYMTANVPSFVYLHFPSKDIDLVERYCRGELVYDRSLRDAPSGALEGDALVEGDELAKGLYNSMLKVRSNKDIHEEEFVNYAHFREKSVEEADEIWRATDSMGNILVTFVKECPDALEEGDLWYVVVTVEDQPSLSHALLFSFPTIDSSLVDRYRHGENLQADEVIQESSH